MARKTDDAAVRKELMSSPHLFSARHNHDYETLARHANEQFGGNMSAKDVKKLLLDETIGPEGSAVAPAPIAAKRRNSRKAR